MKTSQRLRPGLPVILGLGLCIVFLMVVETGQAQPSWKSPTNQAPDEPVLGPWQQYVSNTVMSIDPNAAYNSNRGEYLVVWEEKHSSEIAIYGRRVDANGYPIGDPFAISHVSTFTSTHPGVAYSPEQDKYLVVYAQDAKPSGGGTQYMIKVQEVIWDGTLGAAKIIAPMLNDQENPVITYNSQWDEFLVAWEEEQGHLGWRDIWAQRLNASDLSEEPGPVNIAHGGNAHRKDPDVAYNPIVNGYLFAYIRDDPSDEWDLLGNVTPAHLGGIGASTEFSIEVTGTYQLEPALAAGGEGWLATWNDAYGPGWQRIYARWIISDVIKTPLPSFAIINEPTVDHSAPDVAFGEGFGFLVGWTVSFNYPPPVYSHSGAYVFPWQGSFDGEVFTIDSRGGYQYSPAVACGAWANCLFLDSYNWDIYGRKVSPQRVFLPLVAR